MRRNEKFLTAMAAAFMTTAAVSFSSMAAVDTDFHRFVVGRADNDSHFTCCFTILRVVSIESPAPHGRPKAITFQA